MPDDLSDPAYQIDQLFQTLQRAHGCYEIYWTLTNVKDRARFVHVLNTYPFFSRFSIHAFFVAMLMNITKVLEPNRKTINIQNLLKAVKKKSKGILPSQMTKLQQRLNQLEPLRNKVVVLRNNAFAHITKKQQYDRVFKEADITLNHIRDLLDETMDLLNQIARLINVDEHRFISEPRDNTLKILEDLKSVIITDQ